jgi:hypothetical protein
VGFGLDVCVGFGLGVCVGFFVGLGVLVADGVDVAVGSSVGCSVAVGVGIGLNVGVDGAAGVLLGDGTTIGSAAAGLPPEKKVMPSAPAPKVRTTTVATGTRRRRSGERGTYMAIGRSTPTIRRSADRIVLNHPNGGCDRTGSGTSAPSGRTERQAMAEQAAPELFVGTWQLARVQSVRTDGAVTQPYGTAPRGYLTYTADGHMHAIFMHEDLATDRGTAYTATWEISGPEVVHHVTAALVRDWIGTDLRRTYAFDGDGMTLIAHEPDREFRLSWRRSG